MFIQSIADHSFVFIKENEEFRLFGLNSQSEEREISKETLSKEEEALRGRDFQ